MVPGMMKRPSVPGLRSRPNFVVPERSANETDDRVVS